MRTRKRKRLNEGARGGVKDSASRNAKRVRKYRVVKSLYCVLACRHRRRCAENQVAFRDLSNVTRVAPTFVIQLDAIHIMV